jgi:methyl halide transferase
MNDLNQTYWNNRYVKNETGWDIGYSSQSILNYFLNKIDKNVQIAIPGCGTSYEGYDLWKSGFQNISLLDLAPSAKTEFLNRFPDFPEDKYVVMNFLDISDTFDFVIEQTFFCALHPSERENYVKKMHSILNKGGILVGLLFGVEMEGGPPFGGNISEYERLFTPYFDILTLEWCDQSITARAGRELFVQLIKKELFV